MISITVDLLKIIGGLAIALFMIIGIYVPPTKTGKFLAAIIFLTLTVFAMKYYSDSGEHLDDTLACILFPKGKNCVKGPPVSPAISWFPPPISQFPPLRQTPPRPVPQHTFGPTNENSVGDVSIPPDGWWVVGQPTAGNYAKGSPDRLWQWITKTKDACQPLRDFIHAYPDDSRALIAKDRLGRLRIKQESISKKRIIRGSSFEFVLHVNNGETDNYTCHKIRDIVNNRDDIPITLAAGLGGLDGTCTGTLLAKRVIGINAKLLGFDDKEDKECYCTTSMFERRKCVRNIYRSCQIAEDVITKTEKCPT